MSRCATPTPDGLWKIDDRRQAVYGSTRLSRAEQIRIVEQQLKMPEDELTSLRTI